MFDSALAAPADVTAALGDSSPAPEVHAIAGCACCSGQVALRVTLVRLLRSRPDRIALVVADPAHVAGLLALLDSDSLRNHTQLMRQP